MTTTIRNYAEGDREQVLELVRDLQRVERDIYDRMMTAEQIGDWYIAALQARCAKEDGWILVAEREGEIVGYATIFTRVEQEGEIDEVAFTYGYVSHISVRPSARGSGAGKRLLEECERRARRAGCQWLRIATLARNAAARGIYEHLGFRDHLVTLEKPLA